jgi:hypothetical protein
MSKQAMSANKKRKNNEKKPSSKNKKTKETAIAVVDIDDSIINSSHAPVGQLAKSQRCTQYWTRLAVEAAKETGGILMASGEEYNQSTATEMKYSELDEIRCSKKYSKDQQELTQNETLSHYKNLQMLKLLNNKRTVDMKTVCVYQAILASLNPKHSDIRYKPLPLVIADVINVYMHLEEPEHSKFAMLRQTLGILDQDFRVEIETKEGLVAFIRRYTEDDYFKKRDKTNKC